MMQLRWFISALLLIVVWRHAHWSVALALTLAAVRSEMDSMKREDENLDE